MANPTVSVIMANYNGADHIATALKSVVAQTVSRIEILFSDDASTDTSVAMAHQIAADEPRLIVIKASENAGPAATRNRALDIASGDWVAVVDSDDVIHPQRFEHMIAAAQDLGTDAITDDLTYFTDNTVQPGGTLLGAAQPTEPQELAAKDFVSATPEAPKLGYLKPLIKRTSLDGLRYREDIRIGEDHDFYMRFLLDGGRMHLLPASYYLYRRHASSLSHRLHPHDVQAMIAVQDDLLISYPDLPDDLLAAFAARRAALHRPLAFETLVQNIRDRKFGGALRDIFQKPALLVELSAVAKAKILRRVAAPTEQSVPVPKDPSQWTLQDWAMLSKPGSS